ncbi:uncharacterized protein DS421_13g422990 [Arachis hypogaea]|nr:uncharacterized protein DS421_13g422990 [Arachis hypogaea]
MLVLAVVHNRSEPSPLCLASGRTTSSKSFSPSGFRLSSRCVHSTFCLASGQPLLSSYPPPMICRRQLLLNSTNRYFRDQRRRWRGRR